MLKKSNLYDYGDAYILVKGNIIVAGQGNDAVAIPGDSNNKKVVFKYCAPFTSWISKINNANADNARDLGIMTQQ